MIVIVFITCMLCLAAFKKGCYLYNVIKLLIYTIPSVVITVGGVMFLYAEMTVIATAMFALSIFVLNYFFGKYINED